MMTETGNTSRKHHKKWQRSGENQITQNSMRSQFYHMLVITRAPNLNPNLSVNYLVFSLHLLYLCTLSTRPYHMDDKVSLLLTCNLLLPLISTRRKPLAGKESAKMTQSRGQIQYVLCAFFCIIIKCQLHTAGLKLYTLP